MCYSPLISSCSFFHLEPFTVPGFVSLREREREGERERERERETNGEKVVVC